MNEQSRIITEAQWKEYQELKEENRKLRMALMGVEVEAAALVSCKKDLENALVCIGDFCEKARKIDGKLK